MALPPVTTGMAVVFVLVAVALVLFVSELVSPDVTAIGVLVAIAVLEPFTGVTAREAIAGFASSATVTILAMYMLSEGVQKTGVVERLGVFLGRVTKGDERRLLAATVGTTGLSAGFVNNTPVVAVFIPMITGLARRANISPSKLLLPLSYAAMLGGTLTLVGTSTNILASDFARQIPGRGAIGMFEFTPIGLVAFLVGATYLLTVGRWLTPARIPPDADVTELYAVEDHLARLVVAEDADLVGTTIEDLAEAVRAADDGVAVIQVDRNGDAFHALASDERVEAGDVVTVRASLQATNRLTQQFGFRHLSRADVDPDDLSTDRSSLAEAVVLPDSSLVGQRVLDSDLQRQFDTNVLGLLRGDPVVGDELADATFEPGDTLLLYTTADDLAYLQDAGELTVTDLPGDEAGPFEPPIVDETAQIEDGGSSSGGEGSSSGNEGLHIGDETGEGNVERTTTKSSDAAAIAPLSPKTPVALSIMGAVILTAALGLAPIVIAALGGAVAMIVTGCLRPSEAYDAVSWNVVFLLAGVLPLGVAVQATGGDVLVAALLELSATYLPHVAVLGLFYVITGLLANVVTPVASVVLLSPIAITTADTIGAEPFSFLLAVMFAASAAFMTPIGYQTNLMVYGPGGYRFTDYLRVGGPLQALLAVVVTAGIAVQFGV